MIALPLVLMLVGVLWFVTSLAIQIKHLQREVEALWEYIEATQDVEP